LCACSNSAAKFIYPVDLHGLHAKEAVRVAEASMLAVCNMPFEGTPFHSSTMLLWSTCVYCSSGYATLVNTEY
jgi:hypothetical protein